MQTFHELNEIKSKQRYSSMFVASVSHEFRTPLNIISGNVESLEFMPMLDSSIKYHINNIKMAGLYLEVMGQDLIDFSRMKEKKFTINSKDFRIKEVIQEAMSFMDSKYKDKGIILSLDFEIDPEFVIFSDPMRIKQIMVNFLSNAWKFTIHWSVKVRVVIESIDVLQVSVIDTGIGIAQEDIPKLMKPFTKLDDPLKLNENGYLK